MFCITKQKHLRNITAKLNFIAFFTDKFYLNDPGQTADCCLTDWLIYFGKRNEGFDYSRLHTW